MMCFMDRTFCDFHTCYKFATCSRALTPEIQKAADSFGLPIARWGERPDCFHAPDEFGPTDPSISRQDCAGCEKTPETIGRPTQGQKES